MYSYKSAVVPLIRRRNASYATYPTLHMPSHYFILEETRPLCCLSVSILLNGCKSFERVFVNHQHDTTLCGSPCCPRAYASKQAYEALLSIYLSKSDEWITRREHKRTRAGRGGTRRRGRYVSDLLYRVEVQIALVYPGLWHSRPRSCDCVL